tara:strand:+ start:557 stop:1363 length:807 start_codon:yes stop_codon:yes gene_type:complete
MANVSKTQKTAEQKFPSEIVDLPSKGLYYPSDNPLSSGKVEIKYMTAREEDILTSSNLIKKGTVLDKLLQSLIIGNGKGEEINYNDLLIGDKNAIMFAARILGYGAKYDFTFKDPQSQEMVTDSIDLASIDHKDVPEPAQKGLNEHTYELPVSKNTITFKCLTHADEINIGREMDGMKKISKQSGITPEVTTRLKYVITSINGEDDSQTIRNYVDNLLLSQDSQALRAELNRISPDLDLTYYYTTDDGTEQEMTVPMTVDFFWPKTGT